MKKVPAVTMSFWIVKVLTTAMGESVSDYSVHRIDPVVAVAFGAVGLVAALIWQFSVSRYLPVVYWTTVAMVAIAGTMAADVLHVQFGVAYAASSALFAAVLIVVFSLWSASEKTLSIHSITTRRRETFYWATVLATFALGTATGDLAATTLHLGYLASGLIFIGLIALPALSYLVLRVNAIFAFWFAYIVTRPIGASFADWLAKPHSVGGLGIGDGRVALAFTIAIVASVGYLFVAASHEAVVEDVTRLEESM